MDPKGTLLVLGWIQRAHCWFWGRPKDQDRAQKGHSALWKRPSKNPGLTMTIASFPGLPTVQILIACSMRNGAGRLGPFYHVDDILSTQVDKGWDRSPIERTSLRPYLVVSAPSAGVPNIHEAKHVPFLVQTEESVHKVLLSVRDLSPPLST